MKNTTSRYRIKGKSLSHILSFSYARFTVQKIIKSIDTNEFQVFKDRFKDSETTTGGYSKYLDIRFWMTEKLTYFYLLNLHRNRPLKILDIGTGPGYFPFICMLHGHKVVAIDLDNVSMYNELCKFFNIDRRTWRINKFEKIPDLGEKYDLITALMIKFNNHDKPDQWGTAEWRFLLDDLKKNHLKDDGQIFLDFNTCRNGTWFDDDLLKFFINFEGRVYRNHVTIGGGMPNPIINAFNRLLASDNMFP